MPAAATPAVASDKQIAQYAYNAGWRGNDLITSVAVALAESGGRTAVVNYLGCVGLWQVYARVHGLSIESLKNPQYNANVAFKIQKRRGNWLDWSAHTNGAYRRYMARARTAAQSVSPNAGTDTGGTVGPGTPDSSSSVGELTNAVKTITDRRTWIRLFLILLGVVLISIAILRMSVQNKTVQGIAKIGVNFIPGGKVVGKGVKAVASGKPSQVVTAAKGIGKAVNSAKEVAKG